MKNLLSGIVLSVLFTCIIVSCNQEEIPTEFTLVDGTKDSLDIINQIKDLNEAGEFYNVNLKILDGATPIAGAIVKFTSGEGGQLTEVSKTSDENGNVIFESVTVGGNIISVEKEEYYAVLGLINFRFEEGFNYQIIDRIVVPVNRNESAIVPLFSQSEGSNFATIKGNVSIETDLTNLSSEVPEGTEIKANFKNGVLISTEGMNFQEYTLSGGVGMGTVQADGSYEIKVPVGVEGTDVTLVIPDLRKTQKLAVNGVREDDAIVGKQMLEVETTFGRNIGADQIPVVSGVEVVFPEPVAEGAGFKVSNVTKAGRPLFRLSQSSFNRTITPSLQRQNAEQMSYLFKGGSNYQTTPTLKVADEKGNDFSVTIELSMAVASMTLIDSGQYDANDDVFVIVQYRGNNRINSLIDFSVTADANGKISQQILDEEIERRISNSSFGFGNQLREISGATDSVFVVLTNFRNPLRPAVASVRLNSTISEMRIQNIGEDYIDPVFTFEGGNPDTQATIEVSEFRQPWSFDLDNSGITAPYVIIPELNYEINTSFGGFIELNSIVDATTDKDGLLRDFVKVDADGNLVSKEANSKYRTRDFSIEAPLFSVSEQKFSKPEAGTILISGGEITFIDISDRGRGYMERFDVEIKTSFEGIPGFGAMVRASDGNFSGNEFIWFGRFEILDGGENYLQNVNRFIGERSFRFDGSESILLKPGQEVFKDIFYGTGRRKQTVF